MKLFVILFLKLYARINIFKLLNAKLLNRQLNVLEH